MVNYMSPIRWNFNPVVENNNTIITMQYKRKIPLVKLYFIEGMIDHSLNKI